MRFEPVTLLTVWLEAYSGRRKLGRLALHGRQIFFEYEPAFISSGASISPFQLPPKSGVFASGEGLFDRLFGVFADSLPDGWGRLLRDRSMQQLGIRALTPLDRLAFVGQRGMGALSYEPERGEHSTIGGQLALDRLATDSAIVLAGEHGEVFEELLQLAGSAGGARPKILAQISADRKQIIHGQQALQSGYTHWLIKFRSSQDQRDAGAIEFAYSLMAADAGVEMPRTHLFRTGKDRYFGIQRFDRDGDERLHMHSLSGLIHADHRLPSLDYDQLLSVTLRLTRSLREVEKAYALAAFNVLAHNRDDHAKNFSFLLNRRNEWQLAPAYDLTLSQGPGGEQSMLVMGEGRNPGFTQLEALGKKHGLKRAPDILAKVQEAVLRWPQHAEQAGLPARSAKAAGKQHLKAR